MAFFKGAALTKRKLVNVDTCIDMFVQEYDTSRGGGGQTLYHVIVISTLPFFKSPAKHKPHDVVQFSVARRYKDFEELQLHLEEEFPAAVFPDLPPWRLMCTEEDLEDRQVAFDSLMRVIATTLRLSRCNSVLTFLGLTAAQIKNGLQTIKDLKKSSQAPKEESKKEEEPEEDLFVADEKENEDVVSPEELRGAEVSSGVFAEQTRSRRAELDADEDEDLLVQRAVLAAGTSGKTSVGDDGRMKYVTNGAATSESLLAKAGADATPVDSDLFDVDDDLDKLLRETKTPAKSRSKAKPKQLLDDDDLFALDTSAAKNLSRMGADDFSRYIASNAQSGDVDLFS